MTQQTIKNPVNCSGIGLHTGAHVSMALKPAAAHRGIIFRRTDIYAEGRGVCPDIRADFRNVLDTTLGTTIGNSDGASVSTIEHLMAALWGCGIDNVLVELDGPEVPIMDGSAEPFVFLIECAGTIAQEAPRHYIEALKTVEVQDTDGGQAAIRPFDGFSVALEIDFNNKVVARQRAAFDFSDICFKKALCRARTFGFENEVSYLRSIGLARGGSLKNAIVVGKDDIINEGGLRYEDEFVRHKILDCVGDIYLAGAQIKGQVTGTRSGHGLNNRLLHAFMDDASAWRLVTHRDTANTLPEPALVQ